MYIHIYIYIYTYIYIYIYIYIYTHTYLSLSLYIYIYMYTYIHSHIYIYVYIYIYRASCVRPRGRRARRQSRRPGTWGPRSKSCSSFCLFVYYCLSISFYFRFITSFLFFWGGFPLHYFTTFSDGCLGSNNDEGRSEV